MTFASEKRLAQSADARGQIVVREAVCTTAAHPWQTSRLRCPVVTFGLCPTTMPSALSMLLRARTYARLLRARPRAAARRTCSRTKASTWISTATNLLVFRYFRSHGASQFSASGPFQAHPEQTSADMTHAQKARSPSGSCAEVRQLLGDLGLLRGQHSFSSTALGGQCQT